jgi:solute carrier family 35 protein F1/2
MTDSKAIDTAVRATSIDVGRGYGTASSSAQSPVEHGPPEIVEASPEREAVGGGEKQTWRQKLAFFRTRDFWFILTLGQILAICITGTNTLTTLLVEEGNSIPAFQTLFNYILLNIVYTGYTLYKYGWKKWLHVVIHDGWKCTTPHTPASYDTLRLI